MLTSNPEAEVKQLMHVFSPALCDHGVLKAEGNARLLEVGDSTGSTTNLDGIPGQQALQCRAVSAAPWSTGLASRCSPKLKHHFAVAIPLL